MKGEGVPAADATATGPRPAVTAASGDESDLRQDDSLEFDVFARACPSRETLGTVTGRWAILALTALKDGTYRFNALRRRVEGVSDKMLSQTLHALERDGLIEREAAPTNPPRVDYSLTPLGREIADQLLELIELLESRMPTIVAAQAEYDRRPDGAARGEPGR